MAENLTDEQFKAEMLDFKGQMLRFVEIANQKFDGLASDVRGNSFRIDKVEQRLDNIERDHGLRLASLEGKVDIVSSKMDQVIEKVVSHEGRPKFSKVMAKIRQ